MTERAVKLFQEALILQQIFRKTERDKENEP
jgi:hypothetical protein